MDFTLLKKCMDDFGTSYKVPGLDIIVNINHKEVFRYTKGFSDLENKRKMSGKEIYDIYSMTKMITCTAALTLIEQGKMSLEDEISKYLPGFERMKISEYDFDHREGAKIASGTAFDIKSRKDFDGFAKTPITIKHLFTMSAGFDYGTATLGENAKKKGYKSTKDVTALMSEAVLGFEPGTRFRYSLCHDVLGGIVEVVSGKTLGEYMKESIFDPLGMKNTSFDTPKGDNVMVKYRLKDGKIEKADQTNSFKLTEEYESGGAGLASCPEDYALFLDALACGGTGKNGNRILKQESVELMGTNHLTKKALEDFDKLRKGYGYGLGVRVHIDEKRSGSLSPSGEFGWDGAAGAFSMVDTKNKLSVAYFQEMFGWDLKMQEIIRNAVYSCVNQEENHGN